MSCKVLHIPRKPGSEAKRYRRKKCPDEYLELPPSPELWEVDPEISDGINAALRVYLDAIEKYRGKIPNFCFDSFERYAGGNFYKICVEVENELLLRKFKEEETKIRQGLNLVQITR